MNIYTRTGDTGETGLVGGKRIRKSDLRIDCYGTVDELNALLGWAGAALEMTDPALSDIRAVQNDLFVLGSHLASPDPARQSALPPLTDEMAGRLEKQIDLWQAELPALRQFILPGGTELSARLHMARSVCRRAERLLVALGDVQSAPAEATVYLNRLSDWLFVLARRINHLGAVEDVPWQK